VNRSGATRQKGAGPIKILFVTASYLPGPPSGTTLHVKSLVDACKADHEVRVLARTNTPDAEEYALLTHEHDGVEVHTINNTFRDAEDFFFLYSVPGVNAALEKVLDEFAPDLVHVHHLTCLSTDLLNVLHIRRIPTVMTLHDFWMICPRGQRIHRDGSHCETIDRERCHGCIRGTWDFLFTPAGEPDALTRKAEMEMLAAWDDHVLDGLGRVDRILVPSRFYRDAFAGRGLDPERITVVPHGLDPAPFQGIDRRRAAADRMRVGCLGTVIPSKGAHVLLEAVKGLGDRVEVHIHGERVPYHEDDGYLDRLKAAVPEDVEVTFHGAYEPHELPAILENLDVLVAPSVWYEAFGLTVREGFLAGVPVVASNLGGLAEALEGERGLLFTPGDAEDLRRQLARLLDDPELRDRVRGRPEWVRSVEAMAQDTVAIYKAVIEAKKAEPPPPPDPLRDRFRSELEAVGALDRPELLLRIEERLKALARTLGLEPGPVALLGSLARHTWKIRHDFLTHEKEVDWLRTDRSGLKRELELLGEGLRKQIAWLEDSRRDLESDKARLEDQLEAAASANEEAVKHHQELAGHIERLEKNLAEREAQLQSTHARLEEREALLRQLAGSTLVRTAARLKKIREIEEFKP